MKEVFINYRTGDGDEAAALLESKLSQRFGEERIFRASSSIPPGKAYPEELVKAVRGCSVLLAIMGPGWSRSPQLLDENDWVRREILEAYRCGIRVIPVLKGRKTDRLNAENLPTELAKLADVQSLLLDVRDNEADVRRIGDFLADLVPSLREADQTARRSQEPNAVDNTANNITGTVVQGRDTGDVGGTIIKNTHGHVHAGKGDINQNTQHFSGDGATYIQGDNHGGFGHRFSGPHRDEGRR